MMTLASSVSDVSSLVATLVIIYNRHRFIIQATVKNSLTFDYEKRFITLTPVVNFIKHFSFVTVDEAK